MSFFEKRVVMIFSFSILICIMLIVRLGSITVSTEAGNQNSKRQIEIDKSRGMIYDRNLNPITYDDFNIALFVNPTTEALKELKSLKINAPKKKTPFIVKTNSKVNISSTDILPFAVYKRYASPYDCQLVGYTDQNGNGICGIEKSYNAFLSQNGGNISVSFNADSSGAMLKGFGVTINDNNYKSNAGLVLTIDRDIQRICVQTLLEKGINKGAAVVLNADTGEALALASTPVYDRNNLSEYINNEDLPFLFRCTQAYPVGSVFKSIVAAAAIEENIETQNINDCIGYTNIKTIRFNCHKRNGHGMLSLNDAMCQSCNTYFIALGMKIGAERIINMASLFGFGKEIRLYDNESFNRGNLPKAEDIDSSPALANLSFGQGSLLATPLQIAAAYAVIANGGIYYAPYAVKATVDKSLKETAYYKNESTHRAISTGTAKKLQNILINAVENGSAKLAKPYNMTVGGKTATAEKGDGNVCTWFAGFYNIDGVNYVTVIFKEDGNVSSTDCCPAFKTIAERMKNKK